MLSPDWLGALLIKMAEEFAVEDDLAVLGPALVLGNPLRTLTHMITTYRVTYDLF